jgi:hypothetical protein
MPSLAPLDDDEVLLWQGAPDPRAHFTRWDLFFIPFSILWAGISVTSLVGLIRSGGPAVAVVVTTVSALIGVYLVFGRFIVKASVKRVTVYRLTNRRALIDRPRDSNSMSINPDLITMRRNPWTGHVDLVFGAHLGAAAPARLRSNEGYANSGLDFFTSFTGGPFAFYDVRDREGLEAALARAGVALVDRGDEQG